MLFAILSFWLQSTIVSRHISPEIWLICLSKSSQIRNPGRYFRACFHHPGYFQFGPTRRCDCNSDFLWEWLYVQYINKILPVKNSLRPVSSTTISHKSLLHMINRPSTVCALFKINILYEGENIFPLKICINSCEELLSILCQYIDLLKSLLYYQYAQRAVMFWMSHNFSKRRLLSAHI